MTRPIARSSTAALLATLFLFGCDKGEGQPAPEATAEKQTSEAKKKDTVEALLRENGIDPSTLPGADGATPASPGGTPSNAAPGAKPTGASPNAATPNETIEVVSAGSGTKKNLRYQFQKDRVRKFILDTSITPKRSVNGQPMPGIPPVHLSMSGTIKTIEVQEGLARREITFLEFTPGTEGMPPEAVEQMKAQMQLIKGTQLVETVTPTGRIQDVQVGQASLNNPQVFALLQNLQDAMTNAYLPLPDAPLGVGAKWKSTTKTEAGGIEVTRVTDASLDSLVGDQAIVSLKFQQSAPRRIIDAPGLPPGAQVEILGVKGGGTGTMKVNFATLETDNKLELSMTVDTKITEPGSPEAFMESTDTSMKVHMRVTP